jgi:hypothetical protein
MQLPKSRGVMCRDSALLYVSGEVSAFRRFCSAAMTHLGRWRPNLRRSAERPNSNFPAQKPAFENRAGRRSSSNFPAQKPAFENRAGRTICVEPGLRDASRAPNAILGRFRRSRSRKAVGSAFTSTGSRYPTITSETHSRAMHCAAVRACRGCRFRLGTCPALAERVRGAVIGLRAGDSGIPTRQQAFPHLSTSCSLHNAYYTKWSKACAWDASQAAP